MSAVRPRPKLKFWLTPPLRSGSREFFAVGNTTLIRIDVIVRDSDKAVFMLEGNSLPGFTASSLLPKSIAVFGRTSAEVCSALVYAAYRRAGKIA